MLTFFSNITYRDKYTDYHILGNSLTLLPFQVRSASDTIISISLVDKFGASEAISLTTDVEQTVDGDYVHLYSGATITPELDCGIYSVVIVFSDKTLYSEWVNITDNTTTENTRDIRKLSLPLYFSEDRTDSVAYMFFETGYLPAFQHREKKTGGTVAAYLCNITTGVETLIPEFTGYQEGDYVRYRAEKQIMAEFVDGSSFRVKIIDDTLTLYSNLFSVQCDYIKIEYQDDCYIGDVDLSIGFEFYVDAKVMEEEDIYTEDVRDDEYALQVPVYQRYETRYLLTTMLVPSGVVDAFRMLPFCDSIEITENGLLYSISRVEVQFEWQFDEKEFALITMRFNKSDIFLKFSCCDIVTGTPPVDDLEITNVTKTDCTANDTTDGSITVTATGGVEPYEYAIQLSGGGWSLWQSDNVFEGLAKGDYYVKVQDSLAVDYEWAFLISIDAPNFPAPVPMEPHANLFASFTGDTTDPNSGFTGRIRILEGTGGTASNVIFNKLYSSPRVSVTVKNIEVSASADTLKVELISMKGFENGIEQAGYNTIVINSDGTHDAVDATNERTTTPISVGNSIQVRRHVGVV